MMDIETIVALNKEQGRKSKRNAIKPVKFEEEDIEQAKEGSVTPLQKIVNLGDYVPKGWKRFNTKTIADKLNLPFSWKILDNGGLFVDSSGLGSDNEPALSVKQFLQMISKLYDFKKDFLKIYLLFFFVMNLRGVYGSMIYSIGRLDTKLACSMHQNMGEYFDY